MNKAITPTELNQLTFPLTGSHLIEASAGTGKTFTIAALYVRLVLGHGGHHAFLQGRPLTPPEILVVTFTDAATKELRDRIRARLAEAAEYFRAEPATISLLQQGEDLLYDLREEYEPTLWPTCARKLQLASEWMDEAAVSTIHSWCNRMLREHAFDSQSLFTQNLETDQSELLSEIVRDYWRNFFYPLGMEDFVTVRTYWEQPSALENAIVPLIEHADILDHNIPPHEHLQRTREDKKVALDQLKQPWAAWAQEIKELFNDAKQKKLIDGKKLQARWYEPWLNNIYEWAISPTQELFDIATGWSRLTPEGIDEVWKNGQPPNHPAFAAIPPLKEALTNLPSPKQGILSHAAHWIAEAFATAQKQRAQMGFNDLLTGLEAALNGKYGDRLAQVIRQQFPAALIDEFQDTDPVQYRIFERVYEIDQHRQDCALILIGDPKQAIYAFRGADIHTYLKARAAVQGRLYTLSKNFRSTQEMVNATNHCFDLIEKQSGNAGAFLFRKNGNNPVPFQPVLAQGRKDRFMADNKHVPALTAVVIAAEETLSKEAYLEQMSEICATQIVTWLNQGQRHTTGFMAEEGHLVPLKPSDIAILVNNVNEAGSIRQALSRRGVRSVYLSDKDSVYASTQAMEIYRWLSACAEPDNDRLLRAALSTSTLGLSFAELDALNHDEDAWESRVLQFKAYREIWQRQGVLPMLRSLLFDFGCIERLLQTPADLAGVSGERILTDLLHLAELLQQASCTLEGEHALIRFLAEQQASPSSDTEAKKVRLESDADLVKVVTIHKSKGLEYPVVFLPFICATRQTKDTDLPLKWHTDAGELQIALDCTPEVLRQADQDRLGEDVRKVYVALTRARHAAWLGLSPLEAAEVSAVGHLLGIGRTPAKEFLNAVHSFAAAQPAITVVSELIVDHTCLVPLDVDSTLGQARVPTHTAKEYWRINSYSGLRTETHFPDSSGPVSFIDDTPQAANLQEVELEILSSVNLDDVPKTSMHRFHKGAEAGTFLHELMEWVAYFRFAAALENPAPLRDAIARRCKIRRWDAWIDPLDHWVHAMLQTPLPISANAPTVKGLPASIVLKDLQTYKVEMEFWFETHHVDLEQLDTAVISHTLGQRPRPKLLPETMNGMLKGFMDLVFEYQGKYYVADYKSNWLGHQNANYNQAAMEEAIRSHRYDLQYVIYLFALHRLLKSRMPDYDYDTHVGGAVYLFMRGIGAETAGVHFERPPKVLMDKLDEIFSNSAGRAA
ncbi:exodeoxyribonuclease V subunit beta [Methylomicrobium lacus]|uniref:exodeoxyribonuclease V subunit beta n=1 Tax=Methylomicrobium lacus TaxID=136992 RepID=UPI00045E6916|nr:exodeoxyribonuclease V subunit beta [Methylomicrobium lacus]